MKIDFNNKYKFIILLGFIFEIFTLISLFIIKNLSFKISIINNPLNVFYWLSPSFAIIQTGSFIIAWGGFISSIMGIILPKEMYKLKSPFNTFLIILKINFIYLVNSILTTFIFEKINFSSKIPFSINIAIHSIQMFGATILFLTFWALIGLGVKLIINNKFLSIIICLIEPMFEHYFLFIRMRQLELYLPYALSRELITKSFPFWDTTSWASVKNTVAYASTSLILNNKFQPIYVSSVWILVFLICYLFTIYAKHFIKFLNKKGDVNNAI